MKMVKLIGNKRVDDSEEIILESTGGVLECYEGVGDDGNPVYVVYIDECIRNPSYYRGVMNVLTNATEDDKIVFRINTPGGDLETTISLIAAIRATKAATHASVSGQCMSGGALLAMVCDEISIAPHTAFMIHTYHGLLDGTSCDHLAQASFGQKRIEAVYQDVFGELLTEDEMTRVLTYGLDLYLTADEVIARL